MRARAYVSAILILALAACAGGGRGGTQIPLTSGVQDTGSAAKAGATHWTVNAGASHRDGALQALDFFNGTIVIDVGDSVTWTSASLHTVSFLEGSPFTPFNAPLAPAGGSTEDGSQFTSSGILLEGQTYTLTFTKAGTYKYYCLLHPPEMNGTIIVQPAGTPYPHPQGYYTGQGNAEANAQLSAAQASIKLFPFANGGPMVAAGIDPKLMALPPSKSAVWRFLDADTLSTASQTVTIPVNSTITWVNETDNEPHTVTFPIPGHTPPPNLSPFAPPSGGNTYDGSHLVNSGPFGTAVGLPTNSFTLKFTKPGTFKYFCLFHDDFGMVGWVTVK